MPPVLIPAKRELTPTTSETTALAALVPTTTTPSKTTSAILDEVFALCRNPEVVSFLFTDDTIQLPYLTSSSLFSSAVTGTMTSTRVEPDQSRGCRPGPLSDFVTGKYVFVPAFSVSGVTLGFGMHEFNYSQGDAWGADYMMYMRIEFRFVRNEAKGELLILHDIPDCNSYGLEYSRTVTPTCQTRTNICISRDKVQQVAKSGYLDRTNIEGYIQQINTIYEYRTCPTCHCQHTACRCTVQLARARHAFDHDTFVKNMSQRLGTFEGVASCFCYDAGRFQRKSALGSRTTYSGGIDHDLIVTMRDWAVGLHIKGSESPLQTITAPPQEDNLETTVPSAAETEEIDQTLAQYIEPGSLWLDDDDPFGDLPPLDTVQDDFSSMIEASMIDPSMIEPSMIEALNFKLPEGPITDADMQPDESSEPSVDSKEHAQPLLDVTGTAGVSSERSSNGSGGKGKDKDIVKMLKAEMRRKRNRESAQRSNMKKKAMNDKLKLELKTNKEKADNLRMHESALRQENMRLRHLLAESAT